MLFQFIEPYLTLCHLAAWGLAQNLEGLGVFTYLNSQPMQASSSAFYPLVFDPSRGVAVLTAALLLVLMVTFLLNIRACFYLGKNVAVTGLLLWLIPGLLGLFDFMPSISNLGPDVFRFNAGFPGSMQSAAALLLICLVNGWSFFLLLGSRWNKDVFKNAYDHVWYALGLVTVLYFVIDAGLPGYKQDLKNTDDRMVRILEIFNDAEKNLGILCSVPEITSLSPDLCALIPELKWGVRSQLNSHTKVRAQIAPLDWTNQLASDPVLAHQIDALNKWACKTEQKLALCKKIPFETALSKHDYDTPVVFPPVEYAKAIQKLQFSMEKTNRHILDIEKGHNVRYFAFLMVAFLAGGKLANASRAMIKMELPRPTSWLLTTIKYACNKMFSLFKISVALVNAIFCYLWNRLKNFLDYLRWRKSRMQKREKSASAE